MTTFDDFTAAFHAYRTNNPSARLSLGLFNDLGELPDPSLEAFAADVQTARGLLGQIAKIDTAALGFDERLDLDLARLSLEREIFDLTVTIDGALAAERIPRAGDDVGDGIFMLFINDPRPAEDRLDDIVGRLEATPAHLDAMLHRLDAPVARWVSIEQQKIAGLPELLQTVLGWAESSSYPHLLRLQAAAEVAAEALSDYSEQLAAMPTSTDFHVGDAAARQIVRLRGIDRSLEELHGYACRFLADNADQIEGLRGKLLSRYDLPEATTAVELHTFLNERFAVEPPGGELEGILDVYRDERQKVRAFIAKHDLFPVFEEQDMKILRTPAFMTPSIPAGAMMSPPPFREGVKTSLVYLTLSEELLDEHTRLGIPSMMIHEGIPGHHLQLATAATHSSIIRRHTDAMEQAEGWTTMLEDYMLDLGYMGDLTDEARFITKRDLARIGARVAIDLFFMTGDRDYLEVGVEADTSDPDPFVAAGRLLQAVTGFTDGRVEAELNWYSQERGYPLCYLTGNTLVWELKRDLVAANAGRMEGLELDRAFHTLFLRSGNMPMSYVRRVFAHEGLLG
jgi:uncharacterized protein (DUF885 family)